MAKHPGDNHRPVGFVQLFLMLVIQLKASYSVRVLGCVCFCPAGGGVELNWAQLALWAGTPVGSLCLLPI